MRTGSQKVVMAIMVVLVAMLLIGEWYAYVSPHDNSSNAELSGNNLTYDIDVKGSREYEALLLDNGDYVPVVELYVLFDSGYASNVDENTVKPVGSPTFTQEYFLDQLVRCVTFKGMERVTYVTAEEALGIIDRQIVEGDCKGKGIVFACGSLPDILFSGNHSDPLPKWVDAGGSMYWIGNILGKYVSHGQEMEEMDAASALTGVPDITFSDFKSTKDKSILRKELSLHSFELAYSAAGTGVTHFGYSDGTYSTISCIGRGQGQICIMAGTFCLDLAQDMSQAICSGLCERSVLIDYHEGTYRDRVTGVMTVPEIHGNLSLYVYVGGIHTIYGDRHDL